MLVEFGTFANNSNHLLVLECEVQQATLFVSLVYWTDRWPSRFGSLTQRHAQDNIMPLMKLQALPSIAAPEAQTNPSAKACTFQLLGGPSVPGTVAIIFL
jgi:hypothetical protein